MNRSVRAAQLKVSQREAEPNSEVFAAVTRELLMARPKPRRTCVGCRMRDKPGELVRWTLDDDGVPRPDLKGRAAGRGAWIHPEWRCLGRAQVGLSRSFKRRVEAGPDELWSKLSTAADRAFLEKLTACAREHGFLTGPEACRNALSTRRFGLLLVAADAVDAVRESWIGSAVGRGAAVVWGSRRKLGRLAGKHEIELALVLDESRSVALSRLHRIGRLSKAVLSPQSFTTH